MGTGSVGRMASIPSASDALALHEDDQTYGIYIPKFLLRNQRSKNPLSRN